MTIDVTENLLNKRSNCISASESDGDTLSPDSDTDTTKPHTALSSMPLPAGLYIVATPIGNLGDITHRALDVLTRVDLVAAEDTRTTSQLLSQYHIRQSFISLHTHNETDRIEKIIELLQSGKRIALTSDAGTPAISDPGGRLVHAVRAAGFSVYPIPGPSACITALSASGWAGSQFTFYGFLPVASAQRINVLQSIADIQHPVIFYESPHRITAMLMDIAVTLGADRPIILAKELTKRFETILNLSVSQALLWLQEPNQEARQRGEFVVIVLPDAVEKTDTLNPEVQRTLEILLDNDLPLKQAVLITTQLTKEKKKTVYTLALTLQKARQTDSDASD